MYKRILLAYDGSVEGRAALREGGLLAKRCDAQVFLLAVVIESPWLLLAEGASAGANVKVLDRYRIVLDEGVRRLKELGFSPHAEMVAGEPAKEIGACARRMRADLVVVGHRRQSRMERWWSGSSGAYLSDHVHCSVLISRNAIGDEEFRAELRKIGALDPQTTP
jgi:nucleotide-binding universal stress UspA family protein